MTSNISPEEKLLKLIKGSKNKEPSLSVSRHNFKLDLPVQKKYYHRFKKYLRFLSTQRVISFFFVASCIYLIVSFSYPLWSKKIIERELNESIRQTEAKGLILPKPAAKPLEFYAQGIKAHPLFRSSSSSSEARPAKAASADLIKDINLVGVISGPTPQAIIEDKKTQKTYYLSKGQFIGELEVEDIQEGKIILNYNGQSYELYL